MTRRMTVTQRLLPGMWALALISAMSYLTVSASREFGLFSPFPTSPPVLYAFSFMAGLLVALVPHMSRHRTLIIAAVVMVPGLIYGGGLVTVFTLLMDRALLDLALFWAAQRVLVYLVVTGVLALSGLLIGLVVTTWRGA